MCNKQVLVGKPQCNALYKCLWKNIFFEKFILVYVIQEQERILFGAPIATRGALGNSVFSSSLFLFLLQAYYQISKEAFSLQASSGYQALCNTNLKVVFKPFRAIKPCIRLALALLSLSIA